MTLIPLRQLFPVAGALLAAVLAGCQGAGIEGRIVEGQVGVLSVVDQEELRPDQRGVPGVQIEVRTQDFSTQSKLVGKATSDDTGHFSIPVENGKLLRSRLELSARREGYVPFKGEFYNPGSAQDVIVVLRAVQGPGASAGAGATKPSSARSSSASAEKPDKQE